MASKTSTNGAKKGVQPTIHTAITKTDNKKGVQPTIQTVITKTDNKKLVQPQLSNFFVTSKVHVSSAVTFKGQLNENDENVPLSTTTPSLTTLVESSAATTTTTTKPLLWGTQASTPVAPPATSNAPSVVNFLKTPAVPSHQNPTKKRKLSAESCFKVVKAPKIVGPAECDPEVSSSSETVEMESSPPPVASKSSANRLTLDRFLQSTQQAEVSTTGSSEPDSSKPVDDNPKLLEGAVSDELAAEAAGDECGKDYEAVDVAAAKIGGDSVGDKTGESKDGEGKAEPTPIIMTPKSVTAKPKVLTPKQRQLQEERQKKQKERDRLKREKEEEKEKIRLEKQKEKEEMLKAKQAEKEKIEKEKEEARKKKEEEKRKKMEELEAEKEERKKKEEEKLEEKAKKEEEKKLQEEDKLKEEQEKLLVKEKQAKAFAGFFKKHEKKEEKPAEVEEKAGFGIPFQVREHMVLAPSLRRSLSNIDVSALDAVCGVKKDEKNIDQSPRLYFDNWHNRRRGKKPIRGLKTLLPGAERDDPPNARKAFRNFDPEAPGASDSAPIRCRAKFLQFRENYRPAFFGTFRKTSWVLNPRNPFRTDETLFDYEVDSDDEWEEEEPGEDLEKQSDGEADEEEEEVIEEEEEDPFFVPHGYLSDDEGAESSPEDEDEDDEEDEEEAEDGVKKEKIKRKQEEKIPENKLDPAARKAQQEVKAKAFEVERRARKITRLIPRCVGILWTALGVEGSLEEDQYDKTQLRALNQGAAEARLLASFRCVALSPAEFPVKTHFSHPKEKKEENVGATGQDDAHSAKKMSRPFHSIKPVPEEALPDLLRLVHGSPIGIKKLCHEFQAFWRNKVASPKNDDPPAPSDEKPSDIKPSDEKPSDEKPSEGKPSDGKPSSPSSKAPTSDSDDGVISAAQLTKTIRSIAEFKDSMYMVNEDVLKKYGLFGQLPVPHQWTFITKPQRRLSKEPTETASTESADSATLPPAKPPQKTLFHFLDKADKNAPQSSPSTVASATSIANDTLKPGNDGEATPSKTSAPVSFGTPTQKSVVTSGTPTQKSVPGSETLIAKSGNGKAATPGQSKDGAASTTPGKTPQRTLFYFFDKSTAAAGGGAKVDGAASTAGTTATEEQSLESLDSMDSESTEIIATAIEEDYEEKLEECLGKDKGVKMKSDADKIVEDGSGSVENVALDAIIAADNSRVEKEAAGKESAGKESAETEVMAQD